MCASLSLCVCVCVCVCVGWGYLCGGQAVADGEAVDGDLNLALVDHVDDGLGCCVHGDDWHGEGDVTLNHLLSITLHLQVKGQLLGHIWKLHRRKNIWLAV